MISIQPLKHYIQMILDSTINALIIVPEITKGMKSIGSKALLEIKKHKCVLDYQIESIKNIDNNIKITIATGFESEKIIKILENYKNIDYIYNANYQSTNQAESLKLYLTTKSNISNLLVVTSGIIFKNKSIVKSMLKGDSKLFVLNKPKENFTLGCAEQLLLEYVFYDLPKPWSECLYLNKETLLWLKTFVINNNINQMYLFEIINELLNNNIMIIPQNIDKKHIIKINNQKDIIKAKLFV